MHERSDSAPNATILKGVGGCVLVGFCLIVFVALLLPRVGSRPVSPGVQCQSNLSRLGLAFRQYHDDYGSFPPAYLVGADGNPMHSWRVLLLPYLQVPTFCSVAQIPFITAELASERPAESNF